MSSKTSTTGVDIAYIVSHGFAARMVMQTNLLGKLVEAGKTVALIAPDAEDENLVHYAKNRGIELYEFAPQISKPLTFHLLGRMYMFEDITQNPALREKHINTMQFNQGVSWKRLTILKGYKIIHDLKNKFPGISSFFKKREAKFLNSPTAIALLNEVQPKTVVATYPVNFREGMLLHVANKLGLQTVIHLLSWDNITSKGHFPALAQKYVAWGPIMRDELIEHYGVNKHDVEICGVPHFDLHFKQNNADFRTEILAKLGLRADKKYLFFAMSAERFVPNEIDVVEWLAAKVEAGDFGDVQLLVRPHPQNMQGNMTSESWRFRLKKLPSSRVAVDFPEMHISKLPWSMGEKDMLKLSSLLAGAAVSINSGSTLAIEAAGLDRPSIIISFDGDEKRTYWDSARRHRDSVHLHKFYGFNSVTITNSYDELERAVINYLENPSLKSSERKNAFEKECYSADGKSTERVVRFLKSI